MEDGNKKLEFSPEQLETVQNLSANLAVGQNALTKLLAGQSLEDLPASELEVVEKLLKAKTNIETHIQPAPTSTSPETAQVVKNTQAETKKQINPETTEQLSEQQKQIIEAWQKASEFGKKAVADQMDAYKLNREVRKKFEEELGPLGKQVKYGPGAKIMYIPCTDDEDIGWYGVIHPTNGGNFTISFSKFFWPKEKSKIDHSGRVKTSKLEAIKPLAIKRDALFRAGEDSLSDVERFYAGTVKLRE